MGRPIAPAEEGFVTPATGGEPPVPAVFAWDGRRLEIRVVVRAWRSSKADRGDNYLKRHWFELEAAGGEKLEVYYDREARRGSSHWWLYTIDE